MKIAELREKTEKELEALLAESRRALRQARFKVAFKQLKNVRELRVQKTTIARIFTLTKQGKKQS
ncbi:50S ribosomal protein L29 [Candidatus Uhrbacteria bacterium]|nr:50S ribosomal protein L29 [Candidatus Uhrbacteria bacterium]